MKNKIYLDFAASTPVAPEVFEKMTPYFSDYFANPSSIHQMGNEAASAIIEARKQLADFFQSDPREIIFTSSATEANNLAIFGTACRTANGLQKPSVIVSPVEHDSVLASHRELEKRGFPLSVLEVDENGVVDVENLKKIIEKSEMPILVSVMYANNETGIIQPIKKISEIIQNYRSERKTIFPLLHIDVVQAMNFLDCRKDYLGADMVSASSHKIYGPKGAAALCVRKGIILQPIIYGGGQEFHLRSGTENVPAIVGFGEAVRLIDRRISSEIRELRDHLEKTILQSIPDVKINGGSAERLPNISNMGFKGIEGESIVASLDAKGIECSTGSACSSKSMEPSHVLLAMGQNHETAQGSIRFSLGRTTTKEDIDAVLKELPPIVEKLRKMSPFYDQTQKRSCS